MPKSEAYNRRPWDDRFRTPSIEQLRLGLSDDAAALFDRLRETLVGLSSVTESTGWYGECWRWAVEFRLPQRAEPLAILVPSPEDLQLVMPFERATIEALPVQTLKRAVRDGLDLAREPFDTRWGVWSVQFANQLPDLVALIEMTHRHLDRQ